MLYCLGIDIGSLSCDAVIIDENKNILSSAVVPTGAKNLEAIQSVKKEVLDNAGLLEKDIKATVSTGYGRQRVENKLSAVTEITCHAKGINAIFDGIQLLIDIGGQDSKAILLNGNGKVLDFAMNDKCAAGTGRFLEAMARALEVDVQDLGQLDIGATKGLTLSSMCTVFAESEVVSLIAAGTELNEIVCGMNMSIASRIASLAKRVASMPQNLKIAMSGGVAKNKGVIRALAKTLNSEILVPEHPDTIGALGAALIALENS